MNMITSRVAVTGGSFRLQALAAGLQARLTMPRPSKVNVKFPLHQTGNFNGGRKIVQHRILARGLRPNTFRLLDPTTTLSKPIKLVVTRQNSWEACLGRPMEQTVPDTCAIIACTVCVEALHRLEYEKFHGEGTFKWRAAFWAPHRLLIACLLDGTWMPWQGANVGKVLTKIQQMGGLPATMGALQQLRSWQRHMWDDEFGGGLSAERVAALLDSHGPCVGVLWVCPWYFDIDAGRDDAAVYRGCGRSEDDRKKSEKLYPDMVGWHAVVCFAYRFCGNQMHVLVRDNHDAAANGPQRWIDFEEFDTLYTLSVERLNPPVASG